MFPAVCIQTYRMINSILWCAVCRNRAYIGRERERERVFPETKSTCQETIPKLPLSLEKLFSGKRRAFSCMRRQRKRPTKPCDGEERHPVESSNLIMAANDWWDDLPVGAKPTKVEENAQKNPIDYSLHWLGKRRTKTSSTTPCLCWEPRFEQPFDFGHPLQLRNS